MPNLKLRRAVEAALKKHGFKFGLLDPVSVCYNHYRGAQGEHVVFVIGVDASLPTAERDRLWLEQGAIPMCAALEKEGFKIDRESFDTERDGRVFMVLGGE